MKKTLLFIISTLVLFGCYADSYEKYLGLWERQQKTHSYEVMEITKDGESILIDANILGDRGFLGEKTGAVVLKKSSGQLSISLRFQQFQLGLSQDRKTLRVADMSFKRINLNRLGEIKSKIAEEIIKKEKETKRRKISTQKCSLLKTEYKSEERKLWAEYKRKGSKFRMQQKNYKKHMKALKSLRSKYKLKQKNIEKCSLYL